MEAFIVGRVFYVAKKKSRPCAGGGVNEPREREQSTVLQTVK